MLEKEDFTADRLYIGEQLRKAREAAGFSQEELSVYMDSSPNTIYRFESAKRYPTIDWLIRFTSVTQIPLTDLLPPCYVESGISVSHEIYAAYICLSPKNKEAVKQVIAVLVGTLLDSQL